VSRRRSTFGDADGWGTSTKRRGSETDLDITPMIDVTFLLLIFFMVASTMQPTPDLDMPAAEHGQAVELKQAVVFFVTSDGSRETLPEISDENGVTYTIEQFAVKVKAEAQSGSKKIILRMDGKVPAGFRADLLRAIKDYPVEEYYVGVREKRR